LHFQAEIFTFNIQLCMSKVLSKIESIFWTLTPSDKLIAEVIHNTFNEIPFLTIHQLAGKIDSSATTISRFVKKLGYDSFRDFKYDIVKDTSGSFIEIFEPIASKDNPDEIINKIFNVYIDSLRDTRKLLNFDDVISAANLMVKAKRLIFIGIGVSGQVAHIAAQRFSHLDFQADAYNNEYEFVLQSLRAEKKIVVTGISHSGRSKAVIQALAQAKKKHATTIGISNYVIPDMEKVCDYHFCTPFRENRVKAAALSSCILQISMIDLLYLLVAKQKKQMWNIDELNGLIEKNLRVRL
jgi:DNA-binding MurR/RpiR family transcriptional regulator